MLNQQKNGLKCARPFPCLGGGIWGQDSCHGLRINRFLVLFQVNADIKALINDTTGTLLAVAGQDVPDCHIGLILGTGSNACYMERFDAATIPKFKGQFGKHTQVVINCESGAFGEDGQLEELKVMTDYDKQLDAELPKDEQGQQL